MPKEAKTKEPKAAKGKAVKAGKAAKPKKEKKKKDPNAPKRGLSAYMFFCAAHRAEIKKENPDWKLTEITQALGKAWGAASEAEKQKFYDQAKADKERYEKEVAAYTGGADDDEEGGDEEEEDAGEDED